MDYSRQAPLSIGFPRQEYWSVLPFPSPGDLPNPGFEPRSPVLQADSLPSQPPGKDLGYSTEEGSKMLISTGLPPRGRWEVMTI